MIYELDDYNKNILLGYQGLKTKLEERFKIWKGFTGDLNKIVG
jgi:hypothetical protein